MKRLRRSWLKAKRTARRNITDPALDVLGAGVLGSLSGRTALFAMGASVAIGQGAVGLGVAMVGAIFVDLYIHLQVLMSLRRLMAYEIVFAQG